MMIRKLVLHSSIRWFLPLMLLLALLLTIIPPSAVRADSVVTFPDANLEAAIREAIGKPSGLIYESDLIGLTELRASDRSITNLAGLEQCTNLAQLILNDNQISNLSPLAGLTKLSRLWLWDNQISNLSPLAGLTSLWSLNLDRNQITNLSPLAGLTSLWKLYLEDNQISDISPLVSNPGIASGDEIYLYGNPLNSASVSEYIPALQARGATVFWDTTNRPPNQPVNLSPASAAPGVSLTPTLQSSAFSDPDPGNTHAATWWQVTTSPGNYSSTVFNVETSTPNLTSVIVPSGNLGYSTTYYWHVRYQDNRGDWSNWSTETYFTTVSEPNQPPNQPSNSSPAAGATGVSLTPTLQSSAFSDPNTVDTHSASQWQIRTSTGSYSSPVYGTTTTSYLVSVPVPSGYLTYFTTYYWHVRHQDNHGVWSSWSTETYFTTTHDTTPPTTPVVTDDGATTISTNQLHASWTSSDPESGITEYQYAIGTSAGGTNVVGWTSAGISTQVTRSGLSLTVGTTYYFAVRAMNGAGLWSDVGVSDGIAVVAPPDTTPPTTPVVTDDGATTTSTTQLHASWTSSDPESGIAEYQYAIGTSAGGTNVVGWTSAGTNTQVTRTGLSLSVGTTYYFAVKAKNGEGLWSDVGVSNGITVVTPPDTTPPTTPVVTDDGATTISTTQLHASWTSSDPESGVAEYQYAIGTIAGASDVVGWTSVGTNTQVTKTGLSLSVGATYYFAVRAMNGAGLWSDVGVSNGITVVAPPDTTPPTTPVVMDDGASTTSTTQLHASWTSSDPESGIAEYQYAIGTSAGGTNVVGWTSVGTNTQVTRTGLTLTVGTTYYFAVKARNGENLWSEVGVSDGIAVVAPTDVTPPTTPVVTDDGATTDSITQLHASWTSSDPESGIAEYQYAIGTSAGGTEVVGWTSVGTNTQVTRTGLTLTVGTTYYFAVKARNGADLWSAVGASDGIEVVAPADTTPPTTPIVTDDGANTTSTSQLHASWISSDPESGVTEYQYAIGTSAGGTDVVGWTSVGTNTQVTRTGLSLTLGTTYYFSVEARNGAGLWSETGSSDGIEVVAPPDTTPPTTPVVTDDGATTTSTTQLHASWTSSDPQSGIAEYQYAIGTVAGASDVVGWTSVGTSTQVTKTGLSLSLGTTYYFAVRAMNGAGLWSAVGVSDGIAVVALPDTTPPTTPVVTDDGASTTSTSQLHASWTSSDPESGIAEYQYAIGTSSGATDEVGWTSVGMSTQVTKSGLSLDVGATYYFAVKARNGDGLWSDVGVSNGITVVIPPDTTPPTTPVVTDDGAITESTTQLHASWISSDPESGIAEYQYAIGTSSEGTDVVGWTSTGTNAQVTRTGLGLTVGTTYYFAVKARNGEGLWSEVGVSDGIAVVAPENHPPAKPTNLSPVGGTTDVSLTPTLESSLFSDPDVGDTHAASQWQISASSADYGIPVYESTSQSSLTSVSIPSGSLTYSTTYYWRVRHQDYRGEWSNWSTETFFATIPDLTPPTTPIVTDDGDTTSQLHASWTSSDPESGIAEYQYAIGTSPGATDVVDWTSAGTNTEVTQTGLILNVGTTYYFAVKARNGSGVWSEVGVSDGITYVAPADTTPPTTPVVTDDGATTTSTSQLHASWTSSDAESGIAEYQYAIGTAPKATDVVGWTSAGTNTEVTETGLSLTVGTTYYFSVKAKNGEGLWSSIGVSDGILVEAEGGNGEVGGCCACSNGKASAGDLALVWGMLGLCCGTGLLAARRLGKRRK